MGQKLESYWEKLKKKQKDFARESYYGKDYDYTSEAARARDKMKGTNIKTKQDLYSERQRANWQYWKRRALGPYIGLPYEPQASEAQRVAGWQAAQTAPAGQYHGNLYARNQYYTPPPPKKATFPGGYTTQQGQALMAAYPEAPLEYMMKSRGYNRYPGDPEALGYNQQPNQPGYGGYGGYGGGYGRRGYGGGGGYGDGGGGYKGYTGYGGGDQQPTYRNYTPMPDTPRWLSALVNWRIGG